MSCISTSILYTFVLVFVFCIGINDQSCRVSPSASILYTFVLVFVFCIGINDQSCRVSPFLFYIPLFLFLYFVLGSMISRVVYLHFYFIYLCSCFCILYWDQ